MARCLIKHGNNVTNNDTVNFGMLPVVPVFIGITFAFYFSYKIIVHKAFLNVYIFFLITKQGGVVLKL